MLTHFFFFGCAVAFAFPFAAAAVLRRFIDLCNDSVASRAIFAASSLEMSKSGCPGPGSSVLDRRLFLLASDPIDFGGDAFFPFPAALALAAGFLVAAGLALALPFAFGLGEALALAFPLALPFGAGAALGFAATAS